MVCVRSITIKSLPCFPFRWIGVIVCTTVWRALPSRCECKWQSAPRHLGVWMPFGYCALALYYWWRAEKLGQLHVSASAGNLAVGRIFSICTMYTQGTGIRAKHLSVLRKKTARRPDGTTNLHFKLEMFLAATEPAVWKIRSASACVAYVSGLLLVNSLSPSLVSQFRCHVTSSHIHIHHDNDLLFVTMFLGRISRHSEMRSLCQVSENRISNEYSNADCVREQSPRPSTLRLLELKLCVHSYARRVWIH